MKKLFLIFAILGMFLNQGALANVDKDSKDNGEISKWFSQALKESKSFVADSYSQIINLTHSVTNKLVGASYKKMHDFMNSGIIYTLIALIVCFWLIKLMKNSGEISKEEIYKAIMFVVVFIIIYVILNSKTAFNEVMNMFKLPSYLMQSIFGGQGTVQNSLIKVFGEPFMKTFTIFTTFYSDFTDTISLWLLQYTLGLVFAFALISIYLFYIFIALAVVIAIIVIQAYSIFLTGIYTCFAPIVIFLLLIPQTKSIFFAWLKSYIGITMYLPLSGIAIQILAANPMQVNAKDFTSLTQQVFTFSLTGLLLAVLAITILSKMPTWINELLAVGNQGVGMGGVIGLAKTAGSGIGSFAKKTALNPASSIANNLKDAGKTAFSGNNALEKIGNFTSSLGSAISGGAISKDGFKATGKWFYNQFKNDNKKG